MAKGSSNRAAVAIQVVEGILLFLVGLMLVITRNGNAILNYVIGAVLLIAGLALVIADMIRSRRVVSGSTIAATGFIALGLLALIKKALPIELFVIWFVLVLGSILIIDMILCLTYKKALVPAIVEGVVGILLVIFAVLAIIPVSGIMTAFYIVTGIMLMVFGLFLVVYPYASKR